jgi:hypothetical protein
MPRLARIALLAPDLVNPHRPLHDDVGGILRRVGPIRGRIDHEILRRDQLAFRPVDMGHPHIALDALAGLLVLGVLGAGAAQLQLPILL